MSRKLQSQIQDIKGLPGRFKRILLAWASFANNDGTNIFPAKETVAERAGVSRWTVYENSDILEHAGVLQRTSSHVCRTERCNKGGTHWTSQHGQYTVVYKLNVTLLGNPTVLLQKIAEATVAKSNSATVGKIQPGTVGKPYATRALKETPAPLGIKQDSSVLTDGLVSESGSEASFASLTTPSDQEQEKQKPLKASKREPESGLWDREQEKACLQTQLIPYWVESFGRGLDVAEKDIVEELYLQLLPEGHLREEDIVLLTELALKYGRQALRAVWCFNRCHKKDNGLRFRSIRQFADALASESDNNAMAQWRGHNEAECPACRKLRRCLVCKQVEDMTEGNNLGIAGTYVHLACEEEWHKRSKEVSTRFNAGLTFRQICMECGDTADHVAIGSDNLCDYCRPKAAAAAAPGGVVTPCEKCGYRDGSKDHFCTADV